MNDVDALEQEKGNIAGSKSTKEDWINVAIEILVKDGIDHVKVQVISRRLGVSRSSFYWFFKDISELNDALLSYWLTRNTGAVIERAMKPAKNLTESVCNVFECWVNPALFDSSLDMAVRVWARREPHVRSVVELADHQRVEALTRMFSRCGIKEEEAFIRARVLYFTQIGYFALDVHDTLEKRDEYLYNYLLVHMGFQPDIGAIEAYTRRFRKSKI
ncbi:TetR/AcrR family transcriptional regulator [Mesorhizobium sp. SB112]|uniref:TetR/AcrR family transcriptional regulator n=1 Tax=Mesorhizobium sp. SB112 TaxID=3151853 RepID=UPI0032631A79